MRSQAAFLLVSILLGGCDRAAPPSVPDTDANTAPVSAIPVSAAPASATPAAVVPAPAVAARVPDAYVALGTEPFWSATVAAGRLTYSTPENPKGQTITVTRDAAPDETRFSGKLDGTPLTLVIAPGACSDGMSDRTYPFTARLTVDAGERRGCAHLPDTKETVR